MLTPMIHSKTPAAGTNGDGLDFLLRTATRSHGKDQTNGYIPAFDFFFKSSS